MKRQKALANLGYDIKGNKLSNAERHFLFLMTTDLLLHQTKLASSILPPIENSFFHHIMRCKVGYKFRRTVKFPNLFLWSSFDMIGCLHGVLKPVKTNHSTCPWWTKRYDASVGYYKDSYSKLTSKCSFLAVGMSCITINEGCCQKNPLDTHSDTVE